MKIEMVSLESVHPHEQNPKEHTPKQIEHIAESIKMFGWTQPIIINELGTILVGHGRTEAAKVLGLKELPAIRVHGLRPEDELLLLTIDNTLNQETGFDSTKMMEVYEMLRGDNFPMANLGLFLEQLGDDSREKDAPKRDAVAEAFEKFQNAKEKQMVFYFLPDEFEKVTATIVKLMAIAGVENKAQLVDKMLEHWNAHQSGRDRETSTESAQQ